MSLELETVFEDVVNERLPTLWSKVSYLSQRTLPGYLTDLSDRVAFFRDWSKRDAATQQLRKFWISGFFFPQSLLTSVLQNFARSEGVTVEAVKFR